MSINFKNLSFVQIDVVIVLEIGSQRILNDQGAGDFKFLQRDKHYPFDFVFSGNVAMQLESE